MLSLDLYVTVVVFHGGGKNINICLCFRALFVMKKNTCKLFSLDQFRLIYSITLPRLSFTCLLHFLIPRYHDFSIQNQIIPPSPLYPFPLSLLQFPAKRGTQLLPQTSILLIEQKKYAKLTIG